MKNSPLCAIIFAWSYRIFQGAGDAALENFVGLQPHENDKLESKTTYQAGRLAGNVISIAGSIVEIFEGISLIGGSNFLTIAAEVGTGGLASPIVIPLDIAATAAGASLLHMVDLFGINRFKILRILFKNPVFWWRCG